MRCIVLDDIVHDPNALIFLIESPKVQLVTAVTLYPEFCPLFSPLIHTNLAYLEIANAY